MRATVPLALAGLVLLSSSAGTLAPAAASAPAKARVTVVQAVPGVEVDVAIDGREVRQDAAVGTVLGPIGLTPGRHELSFTDESGAVQVTSMLTVEPGSTSDVVLHQPAAVAGEPVVSSYPIPLDAIAPDKARVLIAHTATVAPADVVVDGAVVFDNIANGEFADAEVPSGSHEVALLPTGQTANPILGPLEVTLPERTVTVVYAYGSPANGSMDVIARTQRLASDGSRAPRVIDTGSAGLAADVRVQPFGTAASGSGSASRSGAADAPYGWAGLLLSGLLALGLGAAVRRG